MSFVVWITGLPGSGKSTIARKFGEALKNKRISFKILRLDEIRKKFVPDPVYSEEERELVYSRFIEEGKKIASKGENLIFDATAHRKKWRDEARDVFGGFMEVYIKCDIKTCIKREEGRKEGLVMAKMYMKALERRRKGERAEGLGDVVGVDVPYEENQSAELTIDSGSVSPDEAGQLILKEMIKRGILN